MNCPKILLGKILSVPIIYSKREALACEARPEATVFIICPHKNTDWKKHHQRKAQFQATLQMDAESVDCLENKAE